VQFVLTGCGQTGLRFGGDPRRQVLRPASGGLRRVFMGQLGEVPATAVTAGMRHEPLRYRDRGRPLSSRDTHRFSAGKPPFPTESTARASAVAEQL
jgi:hypothetical protein